MNVNMSISGLDTFENAISTVTRRIQQVSLSILERKAEVVRRAIRDAAPLGPTGNLKRSIIARVMPVLHDYPLIAIVAVDHRIAPHAHFLEFGYSLILHGRFIRHVAARPFFRPTAERIIQRLRIENRIARAIRW